LADGTAGRLYVLVTEAQVSVTGPPSRSTLALLDDAGRPEPGWPIVLVGWTCADPSAGTPTWPPVDATDGSVRLVCQLDATPLRSTAFAFDTHGQSMPGWPIDLAAEVWGAQPRVVGDRLFVVAHEDPAADQGSGYSRAWWLIAIAADGSVRTGRRNEVVDAQSSGTVSLSPDGIA
jgi:hypothetical protein